MSIWSESLKIKKLILLLVGFISLNGCIESTALLGPAITVGTSGNVYQASISYASNQILYNATGKTTMEHVTFFLDSTNEFEGDLNLILVDNIEETKEILKQPQKNLELKEKKMPEPILNSRLGNFNMNFEDQFVLF